MTLIDGVPIEDLRFLVVEDQGFQRWVLGSMLGNLGAKHVFLAPDGVAALQLFTSLDEPVDVIVTDLDMPNMDGMEFIRRLGESGTAVSLIIASGLDASLVRSVEAMARSYGISLLGALAKPATPKALAEAIARHTRSGSRRHGATPPRPVFALSEILEGLDNDQFEPFFQPKIDIASGAIHGAEALARWRHPTHGIVAPSAFVKTLEDGGHIDTLLSAIVAKAARECRAWRDAGSDGAISINMSLKSLGDPGLAEDVARIVERHGISPGDVVFEITESTPANDLGRVVEMLSRLRAKGFGLSLDDFGTGHLSIQQLSRLPFMELKIDQSFVRNGTTDETSRIVLESSLQIASNLGIAVVAEGVEMLVDWELARELGCDMAQGYFIAMPMEAGAYLDWLRARPSPQPIARV